MLIPREFGSNFILKTIFYINTKLFKTFKVKLSLFKVNISRIIK